MSGVDLNRQPRTRPAFTLLEIMLAMFVFALLISSIFAIVSGTTQLADEMQRSHERDSQSYSFAQFFERTLRRLPAQAQVRVKVKQSGKNYLSQFAILNASSILAAGAGGSNGMTIIETDQQPDGYLRVILKLVPADQITVHELGRGKNTQVLVLLSDVARCEWKFFNPTSNEWEPNWNEQLVFSSPAQPLAQAPPQPSAATTPPSTILPNAPNPELTSSQRPTLVELTLALRSEPPRRFFFWVPPARVPGGT